MTTLLDSNPSTNQLNNAQYSMYGRGSNWGEKSFIAHGLDWAQAKAIEFRLSEEIRLFWSDIKFGAPVFLPSLRMPEYKKMAPLSKVILWFAPLNRLRRRLEKMARK